MVRKTKEIMFTNKENAYFEKIWIEENVKHDYSIIKT